MTNAEKFAKLNGIHWHDWIQEGEIDSPIFHCSCSPQKPYRVSDPRCRCIPVHGHPTFTDAKSILEVMMKHKKWNMFCRIIGTVEFEEVNNEWANEICLYYILNPDKLLDEAIKFCKENKV